MKEFARKLINRLEDEILTCQSAYTELIIGMCGNSAENYVCEMHTYEKVKKIINELAEEFANDTNVGANRWIPCSERLPNEEEMKKAYCRNTYGSEFIVMVDGATKPTTLYRTLDGYWKDDSSNFYKVIAWQPLPAPYKEGE